MTAYNSGGVIGARAGGTGLAEVGERAGRDVALYARNAAAVTVITASRRNERLPGLELDPRIIMTSDLAKAAGADIVLLAVPAQNSRAAMLSIAPYLATATPVVACAKGIERGTHNFMTEVITQTAPDALPAILSGPSF